MNQKTKKLRKQIMEEIELNKIVSTWHLGDLLFDAIDIMGWDVGRIDKAQANLRSHLNKMVKEGILEKKRTGTGFLGKTEFGCTSSNCYTLPGFWKT